MTQTRSWSLFTNSGRVKKDVLYPPPSLFSTYPLFRIFIQLIKLNHMLKWDFNKRINWTIFSSCICDSSICIFTSKLFTNTESGIKLVSTVVIVRVQIYQNKVAVPEQNKYITIPIKMMRHFLKNNTLLFTILSVIPDITTPSCLCIRKMENIIYSPISIFYSCLIVLWSQYIHCLQDVKKST